jgi:glycosyltransferase involved in cell wall biosynthesis
MTPHLRATTEAAARGRRSVGANASVPDFIGVVVPAHDEAERIERCIRALRVAFEHSALAGVPHAIVVVADASGDTTAERAAAALDLSGLVVEVEHRSAGAARRAGFESLGGAVEGLAPDRVWLATTDADSRVGSEWLARQLAWWRAGADAVAGTVVPATWHEHSSTLRHRYEMHMSKLGVGNGHPHVYGANLGMTMDTYHAAGGIPALETGEDHAFWRAALASGRKALSVGDVVVTTSTRAEGRAPLGFAALLRSFNEEAPA